VAEMEVEVAKVVEMEEEMAKVVEMVEVMEVEMVEVAEMVEAEVEVAVGTVEVVAVELGPMELEYTSMEQIFDEYGWLNDEHSNHHGNPSTLGDLRNVPHNTWEDSRRSPTLVNTTCCAV